MHAQMHVCVWVREFMICFFVVDGSMHECVESRSVVSHTGCDLTVGASVLPG